MLEAIIHAIGTETGKAIVATILLPSVTYAFVRIGLAIRMVAKIYKAIMPNGGTGLIDRVGKIEDEVTIIRGSQRWRDTVNESETAMFECDANGMCIHVNMSMSNMFGMAQEDMRGYGWLEAMIDATERDRVRVAWETANENKMPYRDTYRVHNRHTGERFFAHAHSQRIENKAGRVLSILGVVEKQKAIRVEDYRNAADPLKLPEDATPTRRTA